MSYIGYEQYLCANGHLRVIDCCADNGGRPCEICGAEMVWRNSVDQTNGSFDDDGVTRIDGYVELEVLEDPPACICSTCGSLHHMGVRRYKIPKDSGHRIERACSTCATVPTTGEPCKSCLADLGERGVVFANQYLSQEEVQRIYEETKGGY